MDTADAARYVADHVRLTLDVARHVAGSVRPGGTLLLIGRQLFQRLESFIQLVHDENLSRSAVQSDRRALKAALSVPSSR